MTVKQPDLPATGSRGPVNVNTWKEKEREWEGERKREREKGRDTGGKKGGVNHKQLHQIKNIAVHLKPGFERLLLARMHELKVNQRDY